jgi:hypothetical protein
MLYCSQAQKEIMMASNNIEDLFNSVYYILEPHASFISKGEDDHTKYFLPPEVVEVLSWIALNVALPVLVGVAQSTITERLQKRNEGKKDETLVALEMQRKELDLLQQEVKQSLNLLKQEQSPDKDSIHIARVNLAPVLSINGYPTDIARVDADKTIDTILQQYW